MKPIKFQINITLSLRTSSQINFSIADEILKFKQLLDMDIITEEEFEAKKKNC